MFDFLKLNRISFCVELAIDDNGNEQIKRLYVTQPTVSQFKRLKSAKKFSDNTAIMSEILSNNTSKFRISADMFEDFNYFNLIKLKKAFVNWIYEEKAANNLTIPDCPPSASSDESDAPGIYYLPFTLDEKRIRDYSGLTFGEIENIGIFDYWLLLRDSVIYELNKTAGGRELLEECYFFNQTEPDINELQKKGMKAVT